MTKTLISLRSKADVETHLTLHTLTLVCILSLLVCLHFLRCWQGEFVQQSRASSVDDLSLHSRDLNAWFRGDIVRRNWILVTVRGQRVKFYTNKATAEDQIWQTNQQGVIFISMRYSFQIYSSQFGDIFTKKNVKRDGFSRERSKFIVIITVCAYISAQIFRELKIIPQ